MFTKRTFTKGKMLLVLSAVVALAMVLIQCAPAPTPTPKPVVEVTPTAPPTAAPTAVPKVLTYAQSMPINNLDPIFSGAYPSAAEALYCLYDHLLTLDENLEVVPELAESYEHNPEGTRWTFHLKEGVKFHNGDPLTPEDIVANIRRVQDPAKGSAQRPPWMHLTDFEIPDESTVVLISDKPFPNQLLYITHRSGLWYPIKVAEELGDDKFGRNPVGSGPYKVEKFTPGVELHLVRNEEFWGERPPLDKIIFRYVPEPGSRVAALETGEADVIDAVPFEEIERLEANPDIELIRTMGLRTYLLWFDLNKEMFQDVRVRRAFNHAVDKETIVNTLLLGHGEPLHGPLGKLLPDACDAGYYEYDPDEARRLLDEAGWEVGADGVREKDGQRLKFKIMTAEGAFIKDLEAIEAVQAYLKEVGCDPEILKVEAPILFDELRMPVAEIKYDMVLMAYNPSMGDLSMTLECQFRSNEDPTTKPTYGWNSSWYSNPEVDDLILKAKTTMDREEWEDLWCQSQKKIVEDAPCIFLFANELIAAVRKGVTDVVQLPILFVSVREADKP